MRKLLCWLGFHARTYTYNYYPEACTEFCYCAHCGKQLGHREIK